MSELIINRETHRNVIPAGLEVGDTLTVTVTGCVSRIEADLVDVTGQSDPHPTVLLGGIKVHVLVQDIR